MEEGMTRGDTRKIRIIATWPVAVPEAGIAAGDPFPLEGLTLRFTARRKIKDETPQFAKSNGAGITATGNVAEILILPADTVSLMIKETVNLVCDLEVTTAAGEVWTIWSGELPVRPDVTRMQ